MPLLSNLIDLPDKPLISLVGAGGKTTTMYALARELARQGKRVVTTTTTQIFMPTQDETEKLIVEAETPILLNMVKAAWKQHHRITVAGSMNDAIGTRLSESQHAGKYTGKLFGLQPGILPLLIAQGGADAVISEADGARHRMIKAPADYEPVVPFETNVALLLMSAKAINQPLSEEIAHRPERIAAVTGINLGDLLTPTVIARLMTSGWGALKGIPERAKVYVLVTHATLERREGVQELARLLRRSVHITDVLSSEEAGAWFTI
ncbi:MAG TPA: selenium cofactor biosynthesis protein YqeC [Ktedonobacteraceae bacterium]|nr:selenium cofactor biosynthesis protein YqeC [Ktedonobacteraceae bacterium]